MLFTGMEIKHSLCTCAAKTKQMPSTYLCVTCAREWHWWSHAVASAMRCKRYRELSSDASQMQALRSSTSDHLTLADAHPKKVKEHWQTKVLTKATQLQRQLHETTYHHQHRILWHELRKKQSKHPCRATAHSVKLHGLGMKESKASSCQFSMESSC